MLRIKVTRAEGIDYDAPHLEGAHHPCGTSLLAPEPLARKWEKLGFVEVLAGDEPEHAALELAGETPEAPAKKGKGKDK